MTKMWQVTLVPTTLLGPSCARALHTTPGAATGPRVGTGITGITRDRSISGNSGNSGTDPGRAGACPHPPSREERALRGMRKSLGRWATRRLHGSAWQPRFALAV